MYSPSWYYGISCSLTCINTIIFHTEQEKYFNFHILHTEQINNQMTVLFLSFINYFHVWFVTTAKPLYVYCRVRHRAGLGYFWWKTIRLYTTLVVPLNMQNLLLTQTTTKLSSKCRGLVHQCKWTSVLTCSTYSLAIKGGRGAHNIHTQLVLEVSKKLSKKKLC